MHGERQRAGGDHDDRIEALHRIVGQRLEQAGVVRERARGHQKRVAVGRRARGELRADIAARARLVVDHHRLAPARLNFLADQPRQDVRTAARRERNDDGDGAARLLRGRAARNCGKHRRGRWPRAARLLVSELLIASPGRGVSAVSPFLFRIWPTMVQRPKIPVKQPVRASALTGRCEIERLGFSNTGCFTTRARTTTDCRTIPSRRSLRRGRSAGSPL